MQNDFEMLRLASGPLPSRVGSSPTQLAYQMERAALAEDTEKGFVRP